MRVGWAVVDRTGEEVNFVTDVVVEKVEGLAVRMAGKMANDG